MVSIPVSHNMTPSSYVEQFLNALASIFKETYQGAWTRDDSSDVTVAWYRHDEYRLSVWQS